MIHKEIYIKMVNLLKAALFYLKKSIILIKNNLNNEFINNKIHLI